MQDLSSTPITYSTRVTKTRRATIKVNHITTLPKVVISRFRDETSILFVLSYGELRFQPFGDNELSPSKGTMRSWVLFWVESELGTRRRHPEQVDQLMKLINEAIDHLKAEWSASEEQSVADLVQPWNPQQLT